MKKGSYTKKELRFIDNCSSALGRNKIVNKEIGHMLMLENIDNKRVEDQFRSDLFDLSSEEFEEVQGKFGELIIASMMVKNRYMQL